MAASLLWLRRNVSLAGDIALAELELAALLPGRTIEPREGVAAVQALIASLAGGAAVVTRDRLQRLNTMSGACYAADLCASEIEQLLARATFVQAVASVAPGVEPCALAALAEGAPRLRRWQAPCFVGVSAQCAVELASLIAARETDVAAALTRVIAALLGDVQPEPECVRVAALASRAKANAYLLHDLHVYKAKFFPRLARAALNLVLGAAPPAGRLIIDPFAGSGTTLLEAGRLGASSLGLDIDPLSVLIARGKLLLPRLDATRLQEPLLGGRFDAEPGDDAPAALELPAWLERKLTPEVRTPLLAEVNALAAAVGSLPSGPERVLASLCLSDALTRKLRMRFLGTGVGRFALEPARQSVRSLFLRHYRALCAEVALYALLADGYGLGLTSVGEALRADARALPLGDGSVDAALTSPPYLPASSGRENYLLGKAPSLLLLGLLDPDELRDLDRQATGSMGAAPVEESSAASAPGGGDSPALSLSLDERRLVAWLAADSLRSIKAEPVRRYFGDLRRSLIELRRVLRPGGRAAVVMGTRSTFYRYATRETLYSVETAALFAAAAGEAGVAVEALIEVELDKGNRNARPRSLDAYSETIVVLRG
ncbi:MAG: TRM11 family SAM-dependent methyltransferase [Dehalococcoidia bacterium]